MSNELPVLTDGHKATLLLQGTKMDLAALARLISGDPSLDGRSLWARAIREFLVENDIKVRTTEKEKMATLILTQEQTDFIDANMEKMKTLELVRLLFKSESLTPLSREFRAVYSYIGQKNKHLIKMEDEPVAEDDYEVPKTIFTLIRRVNKHVPNPKDPTTSLYPLDVKLLGTVEEKCLRMLLGYVSMPRFSQQMNTYKRQMDRDLFESTFLGMTYDKPDLTREEQEQFMNLAAEIVQTMQIDRQIQKLEQEMDESMSGESDRKLTMTMVELVNSLREKFDKSKERQKKLFDTLAGSRSDRIKKRVTENASILNLVDAWRDDIKRNEMIRLALLQKQAEEKDINRMTSMEDVLLIVAGMSKSEALN